jgi:RNA polymerase sigma factor (sigma-70 family)
VNGSGSRKLEGIPWFNSEEGLMLLGERNSSSERFDLASPDIEKRNHAILALAELLPSFHPFVRRKLPWILRHIYEPEDIVQESYVAILSSPRVTFPAESKLAPWFKGVIVMKVLGLCQKELARKRTPRLSVSGRIPPLSMDDLEEIPSRSRSVEQVLVENEEIRAVLNVLKELPVRACLLVIHHCLEGISLQETASRLQFEPATASRLLYRTKKLIRGRLTGIAREENATPSVGIAANCSHTCRM